MLSQLGDDAKLLAGGQSLIPLMKLRFANPSHLVDLGVQPLDDRRPRHEERGLLLDHHRVVRGGQVRGSRVAHDDRRRPEQAQLAVSPTGRAAHVYLLPANGEGRRLLDEIERGATVIELPGLSLRPAWLPPGLAEQAEMPNTLYDLFQKAYGVLVTRVGLPSLAVTIGTLTLFAFSSDNWRRPDAEHPSRPTEQGPAVGDLLEDTVRDRECRMGR